MPPRIPPNAGVGRRGEAGGSQQPTANSQQPTANSQQPAPSLRSASNQGPSEAKALTNSPYVSACGVVVAGLQSCRRTGLLRDLTRCGCLSGVHAVNAASSAANPATATTQVAPQRSEGVADIRVAFALPTFLRPAYRWRNKGK
ncbi:hypothetical protein GCS91_05045 [Delftia tsuruhatensis]|nr:hypothetical protein GCS91_05045 [Delftia tsuruhatensis]